MVNAGEAEQRVTHGTAAALTLWLTKANRCKAKVSNPPLTVISLCNPNCALCTVCVIGRGFYHRGEIKKKQLQTVLLVLMSSMPPDEAFLLLYKYDFF